MSAVEVRPVAVTAAVLRAGMPRCTAPEAWAAAFTAAFAHFPAFGRLGAACLLAKAKTEARDLNRWDEDLHYTSVARLVRVHGARAGAHPERLLRDAVACGNQVYAAWGGHAARGLGAIQLTGLEGHAAFARDFGLTLDQARAWMLTREGAAMTTPWYLARHRGVAAANAGDMREVIRLVAGPALSAARLAALWDTIGGDRQLRDFETFRALLRA